MAAGAGKGRKAARKAPARAPAGGRKPSKARRGAPGPKPGGPSPKPGGRGKPASKATRAKAAGATKAAGSRRARLAPPPSATFTPQEGAPLPPPPAAPLEFEPVPEPAEPVAPWVPATAPSPPSPSAPAWRGFDPSTGDWLPVDEPAAAPAPADVDPARQRKADALVVVMWVLLAIDLAFVALLVVSNVLGGITLYFSPDSEQAQRLRDQLEGGSARDTYVNVGTSFLLFGIVPALWLLGTRAKPWLGTRLYLNLRAGGRDWLRGLALVPLLLLGVFVLSLLWILATEGPEGLSSDAQEDPDNPAVDGLFAHLTWPLVVFIALAAGIGEEVFFRGVLQRLIGGWAGVVLQSVLFGLAHAGGGFPPQVVATFLIGLLFGVLRHRGWSLLTLIVAHAGYDFVLLTLAMLFPEIG